MMYNVYTYKIYTVNKYYIIMMCVCPLYASAPASTMCGIAQAFVLFAKEIRGKLKRKIWLAKRFVVWRDARRSRFCVFAIRIIVIYIYYTYNKTIIIYLYRDLFGVGDC